MADPSYNIVKDVSIVSVKDSFKTTNDTLTYTLTPHLQTLQNTLTNLTTLTFLTNLTTLTIKDRILLQCVTATTVKEISDKTRLTTNAIQLHITNKGRNDGLQDRGFLELISTEPVNKYKITKEGEYKLIDYVNEENERRIELKEAELNKKDTDSLISRAENFLNRFYKSDIFSTDKVLYIDFSKLIAFDLGLSNTLLDPIEHDNTRKILEIAIERINQETQKKVSITNLPKSEHLNLGEIRSKDIARLVYCEGQIKQRTEVKPRLTIIKFECPSCGTIIPCLQKEKKITIPNKCGCGRRGKLTKLQEETEDFQILKLEELPEQMHGRTTATTVRVVLRGHLCDDKQQPLYNPGNRIGTVAVIRSDYLEPTKDNSRVGDLILEADSIKCLEVQYDLKLLPDEKAQILKLSENPEEVLRNFVPNICNRDLVKTAVLISLLSGKSINPFYQLDRHNIHIGIFGDPGMGKSAVLKKLPVYFSFARYANCTGSSAVGLTASVIRDEISGLFSLEAGTVVLSNGGVCGIDEIDKLNLDHKNALNEVMEQQTVTINKSGVHGSLQAKTSIIAVGNPKEHEFDKTNFLSNQIDLPKALLDRFDLMIFLLRNNREVLQRFQTNIKPTINENLLVKYIAYARSIIPTWTEKAYTVFIELLEKSEFQHRQADGFLRISASMAKLRLSENVEPKDIEAAYKLIIDCRKTHDPNHYDVYENH